MAVIYTSPCIVDGSHIKWAWLRSLAVHDHSFVLNCQGRSQECACKNLSHTHLLTVKVEVQIVEENAL